MKTLIINRHALPWATGEHGAYLPLPPDHRHLLTRTFGEGLAGYDPSAFPHVAVVDTYFPERLEAAARWLIETHHLRRIVALHEKDLVLAARLREDYRMAGMDVASTLRFRDKVLMKDRLAARGYAGLPRYRALAPGEVLQSLPWDGRSVVKSRWGVGSSQVRVAEDLAAVHAAARELAGGPDELDELEVEEFVDGAMYHCDSVVSGGRVRFAAVCEYLAQPGHYAEGRSAGSVLLGDGPLRSALLRENATVLGLLGLESGVTHVEFFRRPSGELVFCEAAARPGGGGIPEVIRRAYGVDLVRAAVALQSGVEPALPPDPGGPPRVVGVVGVYHRADGTDQPVVAWQERIPGVVGYTFAPQEMPGRVRHCTDYAHRFVLAADTREQFDQAAALALETLHGHRPVTPHHCPVTPTNRPATPTGTQGERRAARNS